MSERVERFEIQGPGRIQVRLPAGTARLGPGPEGEVTVRLRGSDQDRYLVERRGDTIVVEPEGGRWFRWGSVDVAFEVGSAPHVQARLGSGDLVAGVGLAGLSVDTASGDVEAGDVEADVRVKSASGDLTLGRVGGRLEASLASGDVRVARAAGEARVISVSGEVMVGEADGALVARTASGDIRVSVFRGTGFEAKTLSGDVNIGLPPGRRFDVSLQTLSGEVRTDFPVSEGGLGSPARLSVSSVSGDIEIRSVAG